MSPRASIRVQSEVPTPSSFVEAMGGLCSEIRDLVQQQKLCFGGEVVSSPVVVHSQIELSVPAEATNPNVRTSLGSASYAPEKDALIWKIKSFPGGKVRYLKIIEKSGYQAFPCVRYITMAGEYELRLM
ncbi:hypothetical protein HYC85_031582 [Camellia sinensis]|uniref:MHD domain-containing protein n=1 Tax=Camellia sinensis TaxID=4442 RepID=A0A7J7FR61_CAMSI|nr:hypothetical protein HYC85_031582 [Camellia sinensis]